MFDRDQLEAFATVAEEGSFERAAAKLCVTRGAISQRVKVLEESLATLLLVRDRPITLTPAGEVLLRHVKALRLIENATLNTLMPSPRAHLPLSLAIAVNADSLATWFPLVLRRILPNPQTVIEVVSDDQDHTAVRLSRGEVIGCITTEAKPTVGFVSEPLGAMTYRCCATPVYAQAHFPDGMGVTGVLGATAVLFDRKDALHDDFLHRRFGFGIERYARHYLPSPAALLEAIELGTGYGLVPAAQCDRLIASGTLVDLSPDTPMPVNLHWHHWEQEPEAAQAITDLIVDVARRHLDPPTGTELSTAEKAAPQAEP